jgi:phosphoglycerate kinase
MLSAVKRMTELELSGKRVMIREDLNAPIKDGQITSDKRLRAALRTIQFAVERDARVILLSHLGRPAEGTSDRAFSLAPVADRLGQLLTSPVMFVKNWLEGIEVEPGSVALCENVRFETGEKVNDEALAKRMAALCDIFVMDAFATAHRSQASTCGIARYAPIACAGPLLVREFSVLSKVLKDPVRPLVAIVGGAKVSSKLSVLSALAEKVDQLIVGGGIANTLLAATGIDVGRSLMEPDRLDYCKSLLAGKFGAASIPLPTDVVVANGLERDAHGTVKLTQDLASDDMIFDIGPETATDYCGCLDRAGTILWNGPMGVFEHPEFVHGTRRMAEAIAAGKAFSVAGGGDTLAAVEQFGVGEAISYISTGGGAFLDFIEGKELPAIAVLKERAQ